MIQVCLLTRLSRAFFDKNYSYHIIVVLEFMNQTVIYLDSLDWIERYSWFGYFVSMFLLNFTAYSLSLFRDRAPIFTIVRFPSIFEIRVNSVPRPITRRRGLERFGRTLSWRKNCPHAKSYIADQHV